MEINNHGKNLHVHFSMNQASRQAGNLENGAPIEQTSETKSTNLRDRLQGDAKVRERLLVEIQAKVQAGEYHTRAAAEKAAQQIVD